MDIERHPFDVELPDEPQIDDVGGVELPPDEPGEGPGRGPQRRHFPVERSSHGLTIIICAVSAAFSGLFLLAVQSNLSGGIGNAYLLSFAIAGLFMGTFYVGGLWLGAKRREEP